MRMIEDVGMMIFGVLFVIFAVLGMILLVLWIFQATHAGGKDLFCILGTLCVYRFRF